MRKLFLDLETYSEVPIKNGTYRYAENAEILLLAYALDDEPTKLWDLTEALTPPADLLDAWKQDDYVVLAHNGGLFDRIVLHHDPILPRIPASRWLDTQVQARSHGLPSSLANLCAAFRLPEDQAKLKDGRQLVLTFCAPVRGARILPQDKPEAWIRFREYAMRDVDSMRAVHNLMPVWNYPGPKFFSQGERSLEYQYWLYDQAINDRGIALDRVFCEAAVRTAKDERKALAVRAQDVTDGAVQSATQRDAVLEHILHAFGVTLPDLASDTIKRRLDDPDLPAEVRELLAVRLMAGKNASSKYATALRAASEDGRVRGMFAFCGATTTGRDSGQVVQVQNYPRPRPQTTEADIEQGIADVIAGSADLLYDDTASLLGDCARGMLVAAPGKKLIAADLSAIEARMLPWLAGETKVLDFFRDYDAGLLKYDQYMMEYANAFNVDPESVTKFQRSLGKVLTLSLGYGGGAAAFVTFAATYHLDLDEIATAVEETADPVRLADCQTKHEWACEKGFDAGLNKRTYAAVEYLKQVWRDARPATVAFWSQLGNAMTTAILNPGTTASAGAQIKMRMDGTWLRIRLPSGRFLCFPKAAHGSDGLSVTLWDRYARRMMAQPTHGGKIAGWVTQAAASCLLRAAYKDAEDDGMPVVLRVHDELVCEVPDKPEFTVQRLVGHLTRGRSWSQGLPLAADGWEGQRYHK